MVEEWQRSLSASVTTPEQLAEHFPEVDPEELRPVVRHYPMRINGYFLKVLKQRRESYEDKSDFYERDPLWNQVVPRRAELLDFDSPPDPLNEEGHSPVPNLIHRYPDRCLFYVNFLCGFFCRFCTRKRKVGDPGSVSPQTIRRGLDYIRARPEIRDVILSGGDPLLLKDEAIVSIVRRVREIPHVELIRVGTRIPCALPQRVTQELLRKLRPYHPIYMMVHFEHPDELTPEAVACCERLAEAGFPVSNQSVLLRGINDDPAVIRALNHKLLAARVRPYYFYQADIAKGANHFRTDLETGLGIMRALRGHTSGLAVPQYVIDAPEGGGKVPLLPKYVVRRNKKEVVMRNYQGNIHRYPLPSRQEDAAMVELMERQS